MHRSILCFLYVLFFSLFTASPCFSQTLANRDQKLTEDLSISVLTFGPGDHPFYKFGHIAILIHDSSQFGAYRDLVYNFGTFEFSSPTLLIDFFKGRFKYWLSATPLSYTIPVYVQENRTIIKQELNLTFDQKTKLAAALRENAKPENKYYKYDYYRDNCSTRVRDAIDLILDRRLAAATQTQGSMTYRAHTLRLTLQDIPVYMGLDVLMGGLIDKPIREWDEMFLPEKVHEALQKVKLSDSNGNEIPLVRSETVLYAAKRIQLPKQPPRWAPYFACVGIFLGLVLSGVGYLARTRTSARIALGILISFLGLIVGTLGSLFAALWACTDHAVAYHNENILQLSPLALILSVVGIGFAIGNPKFQRSTFYLLSCISVLSFLNIVLKTLPWFYQQNWNFIALFLPLWGGLTFGAYFSYRQRAAKNFV